MSTPARAMRGVRRRRQRLPPIDYPLLLVVSGLIAFGFIMVASASMSIAVHCCNDPFYFVLRHSIALSLGLAAGVAAYQMPLEWWQRAGVWLFLGGMVFLLLVLVPGIGRTANGATRWIPLGPLNLQPSEFMKLFAVVYIAGYLVRHVASIAQHISGFIRPMVLIACAGALMLMEPDFGTTAVMLATVMGMLFLGGASLVPFGVLLGAVGAGLAALVYHSPYRLERVTSFVNPFDDPFDTDFQLSQALIAFGRGEWFGVGLGNGIQKQFFLPEAHTDFIAAVVGEEFGLLGMLVLLAAFAFVIWRAFLIAERAEAVQQPFAAYIAQGIGLWIGLQVFINIGVNVGLLPTKGLTLPFLSYGSNSLIVACMAVGLLLRADARVREAQSEAGVKRRVRWVRA